MTTFYPIPSNHSNQRVSQHEIGGHAQDTVCTELPADHLRTFLPQKYRGTAPNSNMAALRAAMNIIGPIYPISTIQLFMK